MLQKLNCRTVKNKTLFLVLRGTHRQKRLVFLVTLLSSFVFCESKLVIQYNQISSFNYPPVYQLTVRSDKSDERYGADMCNLVAHTCLVTSNECGLINFR